MAGQLLPEQFMQENGMVGDLFWGLNESCVIAPRAGFEPATSTFPIIKLQFSRHPFPKMPLWFDGELCL